MTQDHNLDMSEVSLSAVTSMPTVSGASEMMVPVTKTYAPVLDLPKPILERVAAIGVHWAWAEYLLAGMQYTVHLLDRKAGRDYSIEPRLKDVTEDVTKLGQNRGLDFPFEDWITFTGTLTTCDKTRNQLLHAVWFYDDDNKLCIQDIKGEWPKRKGEQQSLSKKKYPGRIEITEEWLDARLNEMKGAITRINFFTLLLAQAVKAWRGQ